MLERAGRADRDSRPARRRLQEFKRPPARVARHILPSAAGFRRFKGSGRSLRESVRGDPGATVRGPRTAEPRIRAKAVESDLCRAQEC